MYSVILGTAWIGSSALGPTEHQSAGRGLRISRQMARDPLLHWRLAPLEEPSSTARGTQPPAARGERTRLASAARLAVAPQGSCSFPCILRHFCGMQGKLVEGAGPLFPERDRKASRCQASSSHWLGRWVLSRASPRIGSTPNQGTNVRTQEGRKPHVNGPVIERTTGFEPATPTLARWCSTN
jgi:hypothetical protein